MTSETYKTKIIGLSRVTIPANIMELLKLKEGDWVKITVEQVKM